MNIPAFPSYIPLSREHAHAFNTIFMHAHVENADLSFPELFAWRNTFKPFISLIDNALCLKLFVEEKVILFPPIGPVPYNTVHERYCAHLKGEPGKRFIGGLSKTQAGSTGLPSVFDRNNSDYVYQKEDLATLPGKKYHAKRNLIRQFEKNYPSAYQPLNCASVEGCLQLAEHWCNFNKCSENPLLAQEETAMKELLGNCFALDLFGGILSVGSKIIAFTVASRLNETTAVVHAEKADTAFKGVYQAINHFFARSLRDDYTLINRESDVGDEGLRKAKLSYYPSHLTEKYYIELT